MDEVQITVIGAGVVGLALAVELSKRHESVVVLERHAKFGQETSSRNSEVIHSGIYYPEGSLKARLCVDGANLLYGYCKARGIPHARIGKLIVATRESETGALQDLHAKGALNGVADLSLLERSDVVRMEPMVNAVSALYAPNTGIVNSHSLMTSLHNEACSAGSILSFNSEVDTIERNENGYRLGIKGEDYAFSSRIVINAAGLASDTLSALCGIDIDRAGYRLRYCKGSYFSYGKKSPVSRLVYPVPHEDLTGLGVHATLDLGGRLRFGPDTEYIDKLDYSVSSSKRDAFFEGASRIIKGLEKEAFMPDMSGIRPKISGEGVKDFIIREESDKRLPGLINLVGIESPGLTACIAIARYVADIVGRIL